ncbi:BQ2448_7739 [Microbotryum intermedium]|uniref:BQ2448_7739 protein n=1 Tax=Microbotryum intermedium TaxID=269621 RepID=A0A238FLQ4_9BASI|nr:BQ2448_7739 [Microbotryum intermedium]
MANVVTRTFPREAKEALATVSRQTNGVYLLSMHNLPDNRLTPDFIKHSLLPALDDIELEFRTNFKKGDKSAALVLTGERVKNKFFSNGLDLNLVNEYQGNFFKDLYSHLMHRLLTFPMHTVSAINGHCFAGGFCLSMCTDWRVIRAERAWMCMNEIDFGAPLPIGMTGVLKQRLRPEVLRNVMLTAHRYVASEALASGLVDEVVQGDGEAAISRALEIAEKNLKHSESGVCGLLKERLYADVVVALKSAEGTPDVWDRLEDRFKTLTAAATHAAKL